MLIYVYIIPFTTILFVGGESGLQINSADVLFLTHFLLFLHTLMCYLDVHSMLAANIASS